MWSQALFSAKNRNLALNEQRMDGYHMLTAHSIFDDRVRKLTHKIQKSVDKSALFIERSDLGIMVGRTDLIGHVLGEDDVFAREYDFGDSLGERRSIRFGHAYFSKDKRVLIPCLTELLKRQKEDLRFALTEAHEGREPVTVQPTQFSAERRTSKDWDRISKEVERGRCNGGLFHIDGTLIERFGSTPPNGTRQGGDRRHTSKQPCGLGKAVKRVVSSVSRVLSSLDPGIERKRN